MLNFKISTKVIGFVDCVSCKTQGFSHDNVSKTNDRQLKIGKTATKTIFTNNDFHRSKLTFFIFEGFDKLCTPTFSLSSVAFSYPNPDSKLQKLTY
jgi:hypothetical protein